MQAQDQVVS